MTNRESWTVPQLARRYGVGQKKILGLIASGELEAINVAADPNGRRPRWRITAEALEVFERRRSSKPDPKPAPRRPRSDYVRYV